VYYQLQQYQKAVLDYDAVLRADPQDAAAYSGRGWSRFHLQQYDDALLDLNTVVRLRSDDATAYADRADVYAYLGQWERAAGDYRVAIRLDNQLGRAYRNVAWLMATCPEQRFRNPTLALRAAERAIELDGPSSRSLDTLAAAQASAGKFTEAVSTLEKALETASNGEVAGLQQRRALYESDQPYLEDAGTARLASTQE
jgi:tetratricopeptide (TPR) repeat protein